MRCVTENDLFLVIYIFENYLLFLQNTSVLENHHWRSAIGCLLESGVAEQVQQYRPELEQQISSLILATDITRQQEFIQRFKVNKERPFLTQELYMSLTYYFIIQLADPANVEVL